MVSGNLGFPGDLSRFINNTETQVVLPTKMTITPMNKAKLKCDRQIPVDVVWLEIIELGELDESKSFNSGLLSSLSASETLDSLLKKLDSKSLESLDSP